MEQEEAGWQENELFALAKTEFLFVDVIRNLMVIWKKSSGIYDLKKKRSTSVWCSAIWKQMFYIKKLSLQENTISLAF